MMRKSRPGAEAGGSKLAAIISEMDQERARLRDYLGESIEVANAIYMMLGEEPTTVVESLGESDDEVVRLVADLARMMILDLSVEAVRPEGS